MSWTDERVERLSTLWLEGRSASQIAAELGEGVSRNAVIGKVHRLGLSGRAVPAGVGTLCPEPAPAEAVVAAAPHVPAMAAHTIDDVASILDAAIEPITVDLPALRAVKDVAMPVSDRVTILELSGSMCRWPIGDPTSAEFRFCGCRAVSTLPYCQEHARVAFQPVADRRRTERMIRIA